MRKISFVIVLVLCLLAVPVNAEMVTFYDLNSHPWAVASVCRLAKKGIINGVRPHYYAPEEYVSRGQLCELLCRIFQLSGNGLSAYPDVPEESYYHDSIAALKALGVLLPDVNGNFQPEAPATRETAMRLTGFLLLRFGLTEHSGIFLLNSYPDGSLVSAANREYAEAVLQGGFIKGNADGTLNPMGYLTRAETAVFLDRFYTHLFGE